MVAIGRFRHHRGLALGRGAFPGFSKFRGDVEKWGREAYSTAALYEPYFQPVLRQFGPTGSDQDYAAGKRLLGHARNLLENKTVDSKTLGEDVQRVAQAGHKIVAGVSKKMK